MGGKEGRSYEGMFIMVPTLNEEGFEKTVKAITDAIKKPGGEVEESQKWGKRRLAFRIRKQQDGNERKVSNDFRRLSSSPRFSSQSQQA